jgi:hypothetical protein
VSPGPNRDVGYRRLKRQVVLPVPCAICGQPITHFGHDGGSHAFDHITPWSDHARDHGQPDRAALFDNLIQQAEREPS